MKLYSFAVMAIAITASSVDAESTTQLVAELRAENVIAAGAPASTSLLSGSAIFTLNKPTVGEPTLQYEILLPGADLDRSETVALSDNITAVHIHDTNSCAPNAPTCIAGDTAGTTHVLNIFGMPREDDADLVVDVQGDRLTGLWDVSDKSAPTVMMAPSTSPQESLTQLEAGELFLMVHTQTSPGGAFGGFLRAIPEPSSVVLSAVPALFVVALRHQR